jgi:hypothetical protein
MAVRIGRRQAVGRLAAGLAVLALGGACRAGPPPAPTPTVGGPPPPPTATPPPATATPVPTAAPSVAPTPPPTPTAPALPPRARGDLDPRFGIAEGFRRPERMAETRAGWDRVVLSWPDIQPDGPDDFRWLGRTIPPAALAAELERGMTVAGLLQFTPRWAATDPNAGFRSPPANLDRPFDDPANYWGRFVYETVKFYAGRIDEWIVWNEPEFRPNDPGAGQSYTWLGTDEQFVRLLGVAYRAAKRGNPRAVVSFPGTSYWVEEQSTPRREQFYERCLRLLAADAEAAANGHYHDAVSLNLYRAPDDLVRVGQVFRAIQGRHGLDKPLWLLELNAMPTNDAQVPCAERFAGSPIKTTMDQQAAYAIQALALAAGAGYQRMCFYKMVDGDPCSEPALWGLTRDDGSRRPVATSLGLAIRSFSGFRAARFLPTTRAGRAWAAWPNDPTSYVPNWQVYTVVFDLPDDRRLTVLWNGDGVTRRASVARAGQATGLRDRDGRELELGTSGDGWRVTLPPATAHFPQDPAGYYFIGGDPVLLEETGVAPSAGAAPSRVVG